MKKEKVQKIIKWIIFIVYIAALVYFVFFAEMFGRADFSRQYRYNLVPFKEIKRFIHYYHQLGFAAVMLNLAGNVVAFMPFGFCLPMVTEHRTKFVTVFLCTFGLSLSIELIQLVSRVGSCDVDDLILNTLGGVLGYICFCLLKRISQFAGKRRKKS